MILKQAEDFISKKLSKNTQKNYTIVLARFLAWCHNELPENDSWVNDYETHLKQLELSNKSINLNMIVIKQFYQYLGKTFQRKRLKETPAHINFLNTAEIKLLVDNAKGSFKGVLMFMVDSGVRVNELVTLSQTKVEGKIPREWIIVGKGNKQRVVVIGDKTVEKLKTLLKDGYIFGKPFTVRMIQYHLKNLAKWVGIKKSVHPHLTRHGFTINMLENKVSLPEIKEMLGHSSILTTMLYTHVSKESLVKAWGSVINK